MIRRILDWLMRDAVFDHGDVDLVSGKLTWSRMGTGFVSGPYLILTNRGGGVLASYQGENLHGGKLLDSIAVAQAHCEGHHEAVTFIHRHNVEAMKQSADAMIPDEEDLT